MHMVENAVGGALIFAKILGVGGRGINVCWAKKGGVHHFWL